MNPLNIKKKIQEIKNATPKINNKNLEQSVVNLGLSITNKED